MIMSQNSPPVGRERGGFIHQLPSPIGQSLPHNSLHFWVAPAGPRIAAVEAQTQESCSAVSHSSQPGARSASLPALCRTRRTGAHARTPGGSCGTVPLVGLNQTLLWQEAESSGWEVGRKMLSVMSIMTSDSRSSCCRGPSWPSTWTGTTKTDEPSTCKDPNLSSWPTRQYLVLGKVPDGHEQRETVTKLGRMDPAQALCLSGKRLYFHLGSSSQ